MKPFHPGGSVGDYRTLYLSVLPLLFSSLFRFCFCVRAVVVFNAIISRHIVFPSRLHHIDHTMSDDFSIEAFTLLSLAVVIIGVRTGARISMVGVRNLQLDDYLMPLAAVVYGLETGAAYCVGAKWKGLANNSMTDAQRKALTPESPEYWLRLGGSKTQVMGWSLYTLLLWLLKACMSVFYSRLT